MGLSTRKGLGGERLPAPADARLIRLPIVSALPSGRRRKQARPELSHSDRREREGAGIRSNAAR